VQLHKLTDDEENIYWVDTDSLHKKDNKYVFETYSTNKDYSERIKLNTLLPPDNIVNDDSFYKNTQDLIKKKFAEYLI